MILAWASPFNVLLFSSHKLSQIRLPVDLTDEYKHSNFM